MCRDAVARDVSAFHAGCPDAAPAEAVDGGAHRVNDEATRAPGPKGTEFVRNPTFLKAHEDVPEARGRACPLPEASFLTLHDGRTARVTSEFADWLGQVA